jgi:hypothetical protein
MGPPPTWRGRFGARWWPVEAKVTEEVVDDVGQ